MHQQALSEVRQGTGSCWSELVAACSLPTVLVLPTAVLHNWPWLPTTIDSEGSPRAFAVAEIAAPIETCLAAALAACAIVVLARRSGRVLQRQFWRVWWFALAGGWAGVWLEAAAAASEDVRQMPIALFPLGVIGTLLLLSLAASIGVAYLSGLPCLIFPRLAAWAAAKPRWFVLWTAIAAVSTLAAGTLDIPDPWWWCGHFGCEGPRDMVLFLGVAFCPGAGVGAYCAYRRLRFGPDGRCQGLASGFGTTLISTFFVATAVPRAASLLSGNVGAYIGLIAGVVLSVCLFFFRLRGLGAYMGFIAGILLSVCLFFSGLRIW